MGWWCRGGLTIRPVLWVVAEALRRVSRAKRKCRAAVYAVATVQEEVGLRGAKTSAYGVDPLVGIAVDVTWATDHPDIDKRQVGECKLGGGPVILRGGQCQPGRVRAAGAGGRKEENSLPDPS